MANQKKGQKVGRNSKWCTMYKAEHRHEKSHVKRIKKHLKHYGLGDVKARNILMWYAEGLGLNAFNNAKEFVATLQK